MLHKILCAIFLTLSAAMAHAAAPPADVPGFQGARWGMTETELKKLFGAKVSKFREGPMLYVDGSAPLGMRGVVIGGVPFDVHFILHKTSRRLMRVRLFVPEDGPVNYSRVDRYVRALAALERDYGPGEAYDSSHPDPQGGKQVERSASWEFPATTIAISYRWSEKTSAEVFSIAYEPAVQPVWMR